MNQYLVILEYYGTQRVYVVTAESQEQAEEVAKKASFDDPQEYVYFIKEIDVFADVANAELMGEI